MIKKVLCFLTVLSLGTVLMSACGNTAEESAITDSSCTESIVSEESTEMPEYIEKYDSLTFTNKGKMGDCDGPSFCVYSKTGYNGASMTVDLGNVDVSLRRNDDRRYVNAYIFLGSDIHNDTGHWINCYDAGFCLSGGGGGWHLFYNIYDCPDGVNSWYESRVTIKPGVYTLMLDSGKQDGQAELSVIDEGGNVLDSVTIYAKGIKCDGSNTSFLTDFALDFPENLIYAPGDYVTSDFWKVILYSTDCGIKMKNISVSDASLYIDGEKIKWTEEVTSSVGIWPDKAIKPDYSPVSVEVYSKYGDYIIHLDMNRE